MHTTSPPPVHLVRSARLLLLALAIALVAGLFPAFTTTVHAAEPTPRDRTFTRLIERSRQLGGQVPVIVALNAAAVPEATISAPARDAQRRGIAERRLGVARLVGNDAAQVRGADEVPFMTMTVGPRALAALQRSGLVSSVSEDRLLEPADTGAPQALPAAPAAQPAETGAYQWYQLDQTGVRTSWSWGYDGTGSTVAVLDSGVQSNHWMLNGKVVYEACFSRLNSCPNGSWWQQGSGSARPCTYYGCDHGTHVAGIAAGRDYGVAKDAKVIGVQVFSPSYTCKSWETVPCARSYASDQIWGMWQVYQLRSSYRIAAVNLSIGGGGWTVYCDSYASADTTAAAGVYASWIDNLKAAGIATVISSGNDGYTNGVSEPACQSKAIRVGNTGRDSAGRDQVNTSSNSASWVSLYAPGTNIYSSVPTGYAYKSGTSMAAPHVAGALAILKEVRPTVTVDRALYHLRTQGTAVSDPKSPGYTVPRVNVHSAVYALYYLG